MEVRFIITLVFLDNECPKGEPGIPSLDFDCKKRNTLQLLSIGKKQINSVHDRTLLSFTFI